VSGHVLEYTEYGLDLRDDPFELGPEVSGVAFSRPFSGAGEGLARITSGNAQDPSSKGLTVEGAHIAMNRNIGAVFNEAHNGEFFPFDVTNNSNPFNRPFKACIETSDS
jgi:hypothetical protein